jgi:hypothetical protein
MVGNAFRKHWFKGGKIKAIFLHHVSYAQTVVGTGMVQRKTQIAQGALIELEVWLEKASGKESAAGKATFVLLKVGG